ncbi:hypothetical protein NL676_036978 [Syzygium grande]|nr:hypothetical protein NL676_036978 [Syzygium grande]
MQKLVIAPNEKELGLALEENQRMVVESRLAMGEEEALQLKAALESKGEVVFRGPTEPELLVAQFIGRSLALAGVKNKVDMTKCSTIWKRYAINDELGVPFAITVDAQVDVAIRERDSQDQVRVSPEKAASVVTELILGESTWSDKRSSFPHRTSASAEEDE